MKELQNLSTNSETNLYALETYREKTPNLSAIWFVQAQELKGLKSFIYNDKTGKINEADHKGRTALHFACLSNKIELVKALMQSPFLNKEAVTLKGHKAIDLTTNLEIKELLQSLS